MFYYRSKSSIEKRYVQCCIKMSLLESLEQKNCGNSIFICNGKIFNYKELITKYNLRVFTESDCEVIPALYELLGYSFINELDGEFSFVLIDKLNNFFILPF